MGKIEDTRQFIRTRAENFGARVVNEFNKPYMERNNTGADALKDNGAYFGFIHPDEEASGPFHDFSFTIFPDAGDKPWLVCLGVGSGGFKNDYELATYPGLRRLFSKLVNERGFCKTDFSDIETNLPKAIASHDDIQHIRNTIKTYCKVLPVCQIVDDPTSDAGKVIVSAFLAAYAKLREWPTNNDHRKAVASALSPFLAQEVADEGTEIVDLLRERKYVVLQGAPGTGKTRAAKRAAINLGACTVFTQFHAETTYSDFICGIRPNTESGDLRYKEVEGAFTLAIRKAQKDESKPVLLIIDEINRANLSNVLGPIFYLFEHKMDASNVAIEITPNLKVDRLPENLLVVATMNTADRSLAVVDFALRRRFAWYTLRPKPIKAKTFFKADFYRIQEIFEWYASSAELSLQPGQGYFLADSESEMNNRLLYEVFPLIQEYLEEGLLRSAKEEFDNYFLTRVNKSLFA